ncbi:hypothetical protein SAMN05216302_10384 [Nitrosomonas aestuarii]|jgi:hypothetical protein|uniref:Uncharacterized protein n=1 Tax=Nitrosomonas aestuarii TaxID=52441 RepID=A0A1I4FIX1_9PROT|nr:hypothetical protein [Nitrosomonas aestuarii]SFL17413.1 hypothetical protein SAMN05216302_10384 [Nitrosomonas aestuarii]
MSKIKLLNCIITGVLVIGLVQNAHAHTRLNVPTMTEGTRIINEMIIGDNCAVESSQRIIGTSVVFPDGLDSTILANGQPHEGPLTDFLTNYGNNIQLIFSRAAFEFMDEKTDSSGNVTGFWAGGGPGSPGHLTVATPFRLTAASIEPTSCATSVKIQISIADICQITSAEQFAGGAADGVAKLWTHNNLGTQYDRDSEADDGPAPFTITRDLTNNPLPDSCEDGFVVEVMPSAAQINRDMPITIEGKQVWPSN